MHHACGSPLQVQEEDSESIIPADYSDHSFIPCSVDCILLCHSITSKMLQHRITVIQFTEV